jgi:hypothetical protein
MPLYYKSLNSHMKAFRKQLNEQEINDEVHNLALKEELNKDNEIYNKKANIEKRKQLLKRLFPNEKKERKQKEAKRKAKEKVLTHKYISKLLKEENTLNNAKNESLQALSPDYNPMKTESAKHLFKYGITEEGEPHGKRGRKTKEEHEQIKSMAEQVAQKAIERAKNLFKKKDETGHGLKLNKHKNTLF